MIVYTRSIILLNLVKSGTESDFVKLSAVISVISTYFRLILSLLMWFLIQWYHMSMCLECWLLYKFFIKAIAF